MRIGEAYTFVPAAFGAEIGGKDTKTIPRRVTGHIEYINRAHRYFTVRGTPGGESCGRASNSKLEGR